MSAIAKPFVKCSTSQQPTMLIPVEKIISLDKFDIVDPNTPSNNVTGIICVVDTLNSAPKELKLTYDTSVLRDASFLALDALVSATVV